MFGFRSAPLVPPVLPGCPACTASPVPRVPRAIKDPPAPAATLDPLELPPRSPSRLASLGSAAIRGPRVRQVPQGHRGLRAQVKVSLFGYYNAIRNFVILDA